MPEKRFCLLWLGLGDELVEVIRDGGEFGGRGRVCALVGRRCGEFGLLWQTRKRNGNNRRSNDASRRSAPRSRAPNSHSSATSRPSNKASSQPNAATNASPASTLV